MRGGGIPVDKLPTHRYKRWIGTLEVREPGFVFSDQYRLLEVVGDVGFPGINQAIAEAVKAKLKTGLEARRGGVHSMDDNVRQPF